MFKLLWRFIKKYTIFIVGVLIALIYLLIILPLGAIIEALHIGSGHIMEFMIKINKQLAKKFYGFKDE